MHIDKTTRTMVFRNRRPVRHGSSILAVIPQVAREWLQLDETSMIDVTLHMDDNIITISKGEGGTNGGTHRALPGRGGTTPQRDPTDTEVPPVTGETVAPGDAEVFASTEDENLLLPGTTREEEQSLFDSTSMEVPDGTTQETDTDGSPQGADR